MVLHAVKEPLCTRHTKISAFTLLLAARALREVVQQLVDTCGPACHRHAADLLWVCLHLRAPGRAAAAAPALPGLPPGLLAAAPAGGAPSSEAEGAGGEGEVEALVQRMAEVCGCAGGADELVEAHRVELLDRVGVVGRGRSGHGEEQCPSHHGMATRELALLEPHAARGVCTCAELAKDRRRPYVA